MVQISSSYKSSRRNSLSEIRNSSSRQKIKRLGCCHQELRLTNLSMSAPLQRRDWRLSRTSSFSSWSLGLSVIRIFSVRFGLRCFAIDTIWTRDNSYLAQEVMSPPKSRMRPAANMNACPKRAFLRKQSNITLEPRPIASAPDHLGSTLQNGGGRPVRKLKSSTENLITVKTSRLAWFFQRQGGRGWNRSVSTLISRNGCSNP